MNAPYIGFWKRAIAFVIDAILVSIPPAVICIPLMVWQGVKIGQTGADTLSGPVFMLLATYFLYQVLAMVCYWLYFALLESGAKQATFGKRIMGIKVIGKDGGRIGFGRATGRTFAKILSYITLYIGYIMAGLTNRKRALHDYIAETYVVRADFQPGDELPDTPSHPWWLAIISLLLIVGMGSLMLLGLLAQENPATKAGQAVIMMQAFDENAEMEDMEINDIWYSQDKDGVRATFENGDDSYTLFLPKGSKEVCCEDYPNADCEETGLSVCSFPSVSNKYLL